ncbi:uncharacterized protein EI97DRAFT_401299 [Westerdykella ornata]|uniref:Camp independent regulatory protein n=1 Tax=Westerdykella ornata TaxID=318751 RepID=A0A6A6JEH1_WESOR|nr:uncharacterized protein EI97DRAFT_401299 [Westerdykella ornata]KAF2274812.1 hypothetical protein EI97DRAFT_401299 [Westerdykella ornata]
METYNGHVRTPADAILLFEACRLGLLPRVQRRLSEKERQQIKSGSVFVWDEREAGMRRWTDGKSWSASRVSGSFLTYREMEGKRGSFPPNGQGQRRTDGRSPDPSANGESEGEGPDGYRYKPDGLMKQSFSITTQSGQHLHLISYFSRSHCGSLMQPTQDPTLRHIRPPRNMYPESTVNESQTVPAVTRGPMPESPYGAGPQPVGSQSPYNRPGPSPQIPVLFSPYPGPPTPPYQPTTYFIGHPGAHIAYPGGAAVFYPPPGYAHPHPQAIAHMERLPPHLTHAYPPVSHPAFAGHPHAHPLQPQYLLQPRPLQVSEHPHTPHYPKPQPANYHTPPHHQQPPPPPPNVPEIPEQGPILPALNVPNNIDKPSTPQSADHRPELAQSQSRSSVTETNGASTQPGATTAAPSPNRTIPNIHTLLNSHTPEHNGATNTNGDAASKSIPNPSATSRSGSRSPGAAQQPPREMVTAANSRAADTVAISRLNSTFL